MATSLHPRTLWRIAEPAFLYGLCLVALAAYAHAADQMPAHPSQVPQPKMLVPPHPPARQVAPVQLPHQFETDVKVVSSKLDGLIKEALRRNPDLKAVREALSAAEHRVLPAGMPDDPLLGYRMKDLPTTFSMQQENATEKQAEFQQRYPFPGKLGLREEIAGKRAAQSREQMHAALIELVTAVRFAFTDVFIVDKDTQVILEHQRRLRDLVDIATTKYKVGPGLQQDVLNADVALARLDSTLIQLNRKRRGGEIRLAALLNQDSVEVPPLGVLPDAALKHSPTELEQMVIETNPDIRDRERAAERDELAVRLAGMAPLPDTLVDLAYGSRIDHDPIITPPTKKGGKPKVTIGKDRPDLMTGQIMFDIPIFYPWKQSEQLDEAQANLRRSRARLEAAKRKAIEALHDLLVRLDEHERVAASFRDEVIPVADAEVSASVSAYQVDKVDFLTLLAAQDNLDAYRAEYWRNWAGRFRDLAQIDEVTGAVLVEEGWGK